MMEKWSDEDELVVRYSRNLALDILTSVGSGHPGATLSLTPLFFAFYSRILKHSADQLNDPKRDRLVLSCGHVSLALYIQLHLSGHNISMDQLFKFRTLGSITPGHPEFGLTPGIEVSSGPLGQGFATSIGIALSQKLEKTFASSETPRTYAVVSDGDIQEGITYEAASLAAIYELDNLIVVYDSNNITIDGKAFFADKFSVLKMFDGLGWDVVTLPKLGSGEMNTPGLIEAINEIEVNGKPTLIVLETEIGWPAPNWKGTSRIHGNLLSSEELSETRELLKIDAHRYGEIDSQVRKYYSSLREKIKLEPESLKDRNDIDLQHRLGVVNFENEVRFPEMISTRKANSLIIDFLRERGQKIVGGSADLTESNSLSLKGFYDPKTFSENETKWTNLGFGVREHAMSAIANGLALDKETLSFCATYFVFSDYQKPAIRMAALMGLPTLFIWTHDSIAIGADGPTHQPIEQLAGLRALPNFSVVRPGSADELLHVWTKILKREGPVGLVLSRQEILNDTSKRAIAHMSLKGGYVYHENFPGSTPVAIIIATGSELEIALQAAKSSELSMHQVRVVSMPCASWFRQQECEYREEVLPSSVQARISVEAGSTSGWHEFVSNGKHLGIDTFGKSGLGSELMEHFGINVRRLILEVLELLES
jgi:transketolase